MTRPLCLTAAVLALGLSACGTKAASDAHKLGTNPQVKKDEAAAQAKVKRCVTKLPSKKAFVACISPPGQEKQVEACAQHSFQKDGVLSRRARRALVQDVGACLVK